MLRSHSILARFCDAQGMVDVKLNTQVQGYAQDGRAAWGGGPPLRILRSPCSPHPRSREPPSTGCRGKRNRTGRTEVAQGMRGVGVGFPAGRCQARCAHLADSLAASLGAPHEVEGAKSSWRCCQHPEQETLLRSSGKPGQCAADELPGGVPSDWLARERRPRGRPGARGSTGGTASRMLEWAHGHERWASAPWGTQSLDWEGPYRGAPEPLRQTMGGRLQEHGGALGRSSPFQAEPWDGDSHLSGSSWVKEAGLVRLQPGQVRLLPSLPKKVGQGIL